MKQKRKEKNYFGANIHKKKRPEKGNIQRIK